MTKNNIPYLLPALALLSGAALAQWEPDRRLSVADTFNTWLVYNNSNRIAADGENLHVTWYDERDEGNGRGAEIYYLRSTDAGTTWSADTRLTNAPGWSIHPAVATDRANVHVAWMDLRANSEVYFLRSTDFGSTWQPEYRLTNTPELSQVPAIASRDGYVHLVWDEYVSNFEINYRRSTDNGATWQATVPLTNDPGLSRFPSVAATGPYVHVAWFDDRDGNYNVYYKRSTDYGATWQDDFRATADPDTQWYAHVAASGSDVHLAWSDKRGADADLYFRRSTDNGATWLAETVLSTAYRSQADPCIFADGANVHVTWTDDRDNWPNFEIYYKRSTDRGASWSADERLTNDDAFSTGASVAASGDAVHVVWRDCRDTNYGDVFYKRNPTGNVGISESSTLLASCLTPSATLIHGTLNLQPGICNQKSALVLYDLTGRPVMSLHSGRNDLHHLAPGVYFYGFESPSGSAGAQLTIVH